MSIDESVNSAETGGRSYLMVSGPVRVTVVSNRQWENENRYGFLRADNAMNVVSSANLVYRSGF